MKNFNEFVKNQFQELKSDAQTWKEYRFRDYMLGNYSKKFLISTFLPAFLFLFLGGLFAAYMLYPESYSIMTHSISTLGNYVLNTEGWWGFSLSLFAGCISLMSFTFYIYRKISHLSPKLSKWFQGLYLTSSAGMLLIAFIADAEVVIFGSIFQL